MFDNLLETRKKKDRGPGGALFSVVFHCAVITLAVFATAKATIDNSKEERQEKVNFVKPPEKPPEPEKKPPPPDMVVAPPPPKGFQILAAPVEIPDVLPKIDLSKKMTDEADFTGKGVAGGTATGVVGGTPRPLVEATLYDFQVEKQAVRVEHVGDPVYPDILKSNGIEGEVDVLFVIDTTGKADLSTLKILKSSHAQFTEEVRKALPKMRFIPAEFGGHKVRQYVQLPFTFRVK